MRAEAEQRAELAGVSVPAAALQDPVLLAPTTRGVHNPGVQCFANAPLQCLAHVPAVLALRVKDVCNCSQCAVLGLIQQVATGRSAHRPWSAITKLSKGSGNTFDDFLEGQQDAAQFFEVLIDYAGRSGSCGGFATSFTFEEIREIKFVCGHVERRPAAPLCCLMLRMTGRKSVELLLGDYFAPEQLDDDVEAKCSKCATVCETTSLVLQRPPLVLTIGLGRFSFVDGDVVFFLFFSICCH
jgi:hypothetical protein